MFARIAEITLNLSLSLLMAVFFIVLAPLWTIFYGGALLHDYLGAARV
jgi:hypothetical protein